MKYIKYLIVIFSFSFLSFTPTGNSSKIFTTGCEETFHFFFLTKGDSPTFWIGIDVNGECVSSHLVQISINNSIASVSSSELKEYKNWGRIPELESKLKTFDESLIESKDDAWISKGIKITAPEYDSTLGKEFTKHILSGGGNAITWYKEKGDDYGLLLPKIEGLKTELLYRHKRGLYFNYMISEVHYFPNDYIIVFTHQPKHAVGDDSMHGFFVFKILKDK